MLGSRLMGDFLRYTRLPARHLRVLIRIASHIVSGYGLIPHARGRIASVGIIEMITVTAHRVSKFGFSSDLSSWLADGHLPSLSLHGLLSVHI